MLDQVGNPLASASVRRRVRNKRLNLLMLRPDRTMAGIQGETVP